MNKLILVLILGFPMLAHAGWLSILGDVSSISSAMSSGQQSVSQGDLKKVNSYLWWYAERKQSLEGYEFLAEALEKSNNVSYLDTVAQTYYYNGQKEKAIELYETRVLPTARATCRSCEDFYKKMRGIKAAQKIPYSQIYKKQKLKLKQESLLKQEELELAKNAEFESAKEAELESVKKEELELSKKVELESESLPVNWAIWGILVALLLNLTVNTIALFKSKQIAS